MALVSCVSVTATPRGYFSLLSALPSEDVDARGWTGLQDRGTLGKGPRPTVGFVPQLFNEDALEPFEPSESYHVLDFDPLGHVPHKTWLFLKLRLSETLTPCLRLLLHVSHRCVV